MAVESPNWWATFTAALGTGIVGYFFAVLTKKYDARGQYEAALIGIGPQIIETQNRRIAELEEEVRQTRRDCQREMRERDADCHRRIAALEATIRRIGGE